MILSSTRSSRSTKTTYFSDELSSPSSRGNSLPNNKSKLSYNSQRTLSSMLSTNNKKKFLVQNKKALETYDRILKQIRQKKKIVITTQNKDISERNSKFLLTSYDFNSITTNDKDSDKFKKVNRLKLKRYKSNVVGVDEGLIDLPYKEDDIKKIDNHIKHNDYIIQSRNNLTKLNKCYDIENINNYYSKQTSRKKLFCSPTQTNNFNTTDQSLQYKNVVSALTSPRRSNKTFLNIKNNYTINNSSRQERNNIGKASSVFSLYKTKTVPTKVDPQMINEIRKLNQWDRKHAVNLHKATYRPSISMQVFLNSINQSSLTWLMDIKSDPKQLEILSKNKYLKNFFAKIEHEHKAISLQNTKLNKNEFDFGVFEQDSYSHRKSSSLGGDILVHVDVYKEIMKERIKIEEMLKADLCGIAQQLYDLKTEKKSLVVDLYDASNEMNDLFKQIEHIKSEDQLKRKHLQEDITEEYENMLRIGNNNSSRKNTRRGNKLHSEKRKDILFMQKSKMLGTQTLLEHELQQKLTIINRKKSVLEIKINKLNEELEGINENMRKIKIRLTHRLKALTNYYLDILSKGIDVRRNGISWVVIRLISLNAFFTYENFPVFLTHEQIDFVIKISYMQHELNELIELFRILKKKQSNLRDEQVHNQELLRNTQQEFNKEKEDYKSIKNLIKQIESVAKKYEQVVKICLNEKKDDEHLNEICKALHAKIIDLHRESEIEDEKQGDNYLKGFKLFFLPGSLLKFFSENKKYKMYFDDIIYLNNEITKREKELSNIKEQQLKLFRKQTKHSKNTVQNEMIFAALFGNGITV